MPDMLIRCPACMALANPTWTACAACKRPLPARSDLEPGCLVWWRSMDGVIRGPAVLRGTFEDQGQVWAWFALGAIEYLIRADLIVRIQRPEDE